jgi:ribosomal protein S27E
MTVREIRQRFPRKFGKCPDCGWEGIVYASFEHFIAGDY